MLNGNIQPTFANTDKIDFPENIENFNLNESNAFDKSLRSSLARDNHLPLRVTTRAEEIQQREN